MGAVIGGFFLAMALAVAILSTRYFFRKRGPNAAFLYVAGFWGLMALALVLVARGKPNWLSLIAVGLCLLTNAAYGVYLEMLRKDLREAPRDGDESAPQQAMRKCPGCGLSVDAAREKCPMCGAGRGVSR